MYLYYVMWFVPFSFYCNCCRMPQGSTLGMNATLKNESPVGDTYTEKNPRFVPEGRWRMPRPSGTGFFTYNVIREVVVLIVA